MTGHVYHLHSTLELPLEDLHAFLEDPELPEGVNDIELTRRNNTLIIRAIAPEGAVGKYTPTAQIKGTVTETRVPDEEAAVPQPSGPAWGEEEEEQPTKLIEVAAFKGDREAILQNSALQYSMFQLLRNLAFEAQTGTLTAIIAEEDDLSAVRIVDGEERPASVKVVEDRSATQNTGNIDWRDNEYING